jgi:hypothetical protein
MMNDAKLKPLAAKYPLVLLAEIPVEGNNAGPGDAVPTKTQFSFVHETMDFRKLSDGPDLRFLADEEKSLAIQRRLRNFIVDLGKQDFEKNPDLEKITIDHPGLSGYGGTARDGHLYLQHINTRRGSDFYVVFQIVAVEKDGQYMAFLWRKLPGGKVVKQAQPK